MALPGVTNIARYNAYCSTNVRLETIPDNTVPALLGRGGGVQGVLGWWYEVLGCPVAGILHGSDCSDLVATLHTW